MNRNNKKECDVAVVGLGVMGSGALYECSKRGLKCIGIEQYSMPHSRGSSHGHTRITRHLYKEPHFASVMISFKSINHMLKIGDVMFWMKVVNSKRYYQIVSKGIMEALGATWRRSKHPTYNPNWY